MTDERRINIQTSENRLEVHVTGKLEKSDYKMFVPRIESLIQIYGKVRLLLYLKAFQGWSAGALWEDVKFDARHFNDIERLAIVGESTWHERMAAFCKPFTTAEIKYFEHDQLPTARQWIAAE